MRPSKKTFEVLGVDFSQKAYVFLDEIQLSPELPSVVKYLLDHYGIKFFLTGSAGFSLQNLFTESLAGRKYLFELFPLTFREFLAFKESPLKGLEHTPSSKAIYETVQMFCEEYL
ncbi:MAG: AAA family ATPase [Candidatus Caldatribacteriaceae bacterium]